MRVKLLFYPGTKVSAFALIFDTCLATPVYRRFGLPAWELNFRSGIGGLFSIKGKILNIFSFRPCAPVTVIQLCVCHTKAA